ncbi:hypothetical protein LZC95_12130 [Pendulispora brunnea]|uniref:Uncharacterized protein n=1 Tax=Pendulispora brunnea TaxID=2905690 RepID=A0ABZ2KHP8_9BACT
MRQWSFALSFACIAAFSVHCSLTSSPGDYSSEYLTPQIAAAPSHVLVVAGQRDALSGELGDIPTGDAWTARLRADGSIVGWTAVPSAPVLQNSRATLLLNGNLYVPGVRSRKAADDVQFHVGIGLIPLANESLGSSWNVTFADLSQNGDSGLLFLPQGVLSVGGFDSQTTLSYLDDVWFSAFDEAQKTFSPRADVGLKTVKKRGHPTVVAYKNFVYVMGGDSPQDTKSASVEFSVLTDKLSPFTETTAMQNPATGQPHRIENFTVCTGEGTIYVIGGRPVGSPTDVVLMSRIDEANGQLGPWQAMNKLPAARAGAGCFIAHEKLYVLGGLGTSERATSVFWAPIRPDGTLGPWDAQSSAPLPAARSQIAATAY